MATAPLEPQRISVEEYLRTVYEPDCDYVDGVVEERNLGEIDHSQIRLNLIVSFHSVFRGTDLKVWPELRYQTKPTRFQVPDVLVTRGKPAGTILKEAPLLCIEILSPEDRWGKVMKKMEEYLEDGVPEVWVIDPTEHVLWICKPGSIVVASDPVRLTGASVDLQLKDIFE